VTVCDGACKYYLEVLPHFYEIPHGPHEWRLPNRVVASGAGAELAVSRRDDASTLEVRGFCLFAV